MSAVASPPSDLSLTNLTVSGHLTSNTVTSNACIARHMDTTSLVIQSKTGSNPGWVLTAVDTIGTSLWAPREM